jgi:hypothetical protein
MQTFLLAVNYISIDVIKTLTLICVNNIITLVKKINFALKEPVIMTTLIQTRRINIIDELLVMQSATELAHFTGRDEDWEPENLVEAIEELESIGEGSPRSNGYEISTEEFIAIEETTAINLDISELIKNKRQALPNDAEYIKELERLLSVSPVQTESPWFSTDIKPTIGEYVLGKFKSMYHGVVNHYCDCFWDGKYWKFMGNDRVEDTYCDAPIEWQSLPKS